ncbi:hypothetical protein GQ42DRAFT_27995 [Ramicandelaber brevisporus]|nr:hypothetical protein GQ42DRAFT_27995 [Ramicandelaber brevisporus]
MRLQMASADRPRSQPASTRSSRTALPATQAENGCIFRMDFGAVCCLEISLVSLSHSASQPHPACDSSIQHPPARQQRNSTLRAIGLSRAFDIVDH